MTSRFFQAALAVTGLTLGAVTHATPIAGNSLQNAITALGGVVDVQTDQVQHDSMWRVGAIRFAISQIQFEDTAFANLNAFGIYDVFDPTRRLTLYTGTDGAGTNGFIHNPVGNSYCAWTFANFGNPAQCALFDSTQFGFFLSTPTGTFFSQKHLNNDGIDHLVAFEGGPTRGTLNGNPWLSNEYLLAWEDVFGGGDADYNDFVVLIESVIGVPEPADLGLFGLGLIALGLLAQRRLRAQVKARR